MTADDIKAIAYDANLDYYEGYSGRGMFGRKCPGITTEDKNLLRAAADLVEGCSSVEAAGRLLRTARVDDMGLGLIVYWPEIQA